MISHSGTGRLPAVLDIGNGSIRVIVADALEGGALQVVGIGVENSAGIDDGRIVDLNAATAALSRAVRTAELESGRSINEVLVAVSGECIQGHACEGKTVVGGARREPPAEEYDLWRQTDGDVVGGFDLFKVREMGVAAVSSGDVEVLDVINKGYRLDRQHNIRNPLGMSGRLLTGDMHLIVAERQALENIEKCVQNAGMVLAGRAVFSGLAAARAVLSEEERKLGVCLLDIGAQTTEIVIFCNGGVYNTHVTLEAANLIHSDISTVHHTTLASAELCKRQIGVRMPPAAQGLQGGDELLTLESTSGEQISVSHSLVLRTVTSRVEVLLECVDELLRAVEKREQRKLTAGIVLVGGGAMLPGLPAMVNNRLQIPARIGVPAYNGDKRERVKSPAFATAIGLLMMACDLAGKNRALPFVTQLKNFFFRPNSKEMKHGH